MKNVRQKGIFIYLTMYLYKIYLALSVYILHQ